MVWQRRSNGLATWIERFGKADDEWHSQIQVIRRCIRRLTSGHLSAAADSKTSPRNPVLCIVLYLENAASLGWILNCKFRPLNSQSLALQSQCQTL